MEGDMEGGPAETQEGQSALKHNIQTKGKNAYYYAHGHGADGPEWDGNEAPRLLERSGVEASVSPQTRPKRTTIAITKYSFDAQGPKVRLYIPTEDFDPPLRDEDAVSLSFEATSLTVDMQGSQGDESYLLHVPSLFDEIEAATFRRKETKVVVTLTKKLDVPWTSLKK